MGNFTSLDISITLIYIIAVLGVGLIASRRSKENSAGYFLAGRNVGWIAIGASLFATNISGEHFIGLAGSGAARGLAVGHFEWIAALVILLLGWVFVPLYLKSGVFTMPEFLEKRYNTASRMYLTSVSIVAYILTKVSITLFAGGLLLNALLGWDIYTSAVVMVVLTGIYTIIGGLSAVIYTGMIQAVFLIGGAVILTVMGLNEVGGFTALQQKLPADYFSMFKPMSDPDFPWTGIVFGAPIIGVWYWCTDQYIVQRVLSAKNVYNAQSGTILAGFLKILPVFLFVFPGMIAAALYPEIKGDEAYPVMIAGMLMPVGFRGLIMAGLLAALMSSLAGVFNSASTLFTMDFYKYFHPKASERKLVLVGRLATTIIVITGILWVPLTKIINSHIYIYLQSIQAYISPPITAVFLFGIFNKRLNGKGAIWALAVGGVVGALRLIFELLHKCNYVSNPLINWFVGINYLHFAVFLFIISTVVLHWVSLRNTTAVRSDISGTVTSFPYGVKIAAGYNNPKNSKWNNLNIAFSIVLIMAVFTLWGAFF